MVSIAHAAEAAPAAGGFGAFIPLILIFVIFYFLLIRPQQKKAKEHQQFLQELKIGDKVVGGGGIYGTITALEDNEVTLEIADKVRVKVARPYILGPASGEQQGPAQAKPTGG